MGKRQALTSSGVLNSLRQGWSASVPLAQPIIVLNHGLVDHYWELCGEMPKFFIRHR